MRVLFLAALLGIAQGLDMRVANGWRVAARVATAEAPQMNLTVLAPLTAGTYATIPGPAMKLPIIVAEASKTHVVLPPPSSWDVCNSSRVTLVLFNMSNLLMGEIHCDLDHQWTTDGIDRARVRWVSALERPVQVRAVTAECFKCRKPVQTPLLVPGAVSVSYPVRPGSNLPGRPEPKAPGYAVFRTAFDVEFDVVRAPAWDSLPAPGSAGVPLSAPFCSETVVVSQHSVVTVILLPSKGEACQPLVVTDVEGSSTWAPLVVGVVSTIAFGLLLWFALRQWDHYRKGGRDAGDDDLSGSTAYTTPDGRDLRASTPSKAKSARVEAIDIWRGMCLFIMVFVNYGGAGYWWLDHSAWNGLTVADVVFACFVFTMGGSMALSLRSQRKKGASSCDMTRRMAWRALKLLLVGLFLNNGLVLEQWRFPGVLQYFAVAALVVSCIAIWVPKLAFADTEADSPASDDAAAAAGGGSASGSPDWPAGASSSSSSGAGAGLRARSVNGAGDVYDEANAEFMAQAPLTAYDALEADTAAAAEWQQGRRASRHTDGCSTATRVVCGDVMPYVLEWIIIVALEAVYLSVQFFMPVPGCPTGYLGPGGLSEDAKYFNCPGGAHGYIDRVVWGQNHMYHNWDANGAVVSAATCADSYRCPVYDPEGTLGAINAVVIAFLGLQAGRIMLKHKTAGLGSVATRWLVWGVACGLVAGGLCGFSKEGGVIPVAKNLWSPSYILGMAGASFFMLAVLLLVVDRARLWDGAPFTFIGKNSIAIYCISEIFQMYAPFTIVANANPAFAVDQEFRSHTEAAVANFIGVTCNALVALWMMRNKIFVKL